MFWGFGGRGGGGGGGGGVPCVAVVVAVWYGVVAVWVVSGGLGGLGCLGGYENFCDFAKGCDIVFYIFMVKTNFKVLHLDFFQVYSINPALFPVKQIKV